MAAMCQSGGCSRSVVPLEASKGGVKVSRMKDPFFSDSYLWITFILPFEALGISDARMH